MRSMCPNVILLFSPVGRETLSSEMSVACASFGARTASRAKLASRVGRKLIIGDP